MSANATSARARRRRAPRSDLRRRAGSRPRSARSDGGAITRIRGFVNARSARGATVRGGWVRASRARERGARMRARASASASRIGAVDEAERSEEALPRARQLADLAEEGAAVPASRAVRAASERERVGEVDTPHTHTPRPRSAASQPCFLVSEPGPRAVRRHPAPHPAPVTARRRSTARRLSAGGHWPVWPGPGSCWRPAGSRSMVMMNSRTTHRMMPLLKKWYQASFHSFAVPFRIGSGRTRGGEPGKLATATPQKGKTRFFPVEFDTTNAIRSDLSRSLRMRARNNAEDAPRSKYIALSNTLRTLLPLCLRSSFWSCRVCFFTCVAFVLNCIRFGPAGRRASCNVSSKCI